MIAIAIKTPQLIGIALGCFVFLMTMIVVFYLLYASGTFANLSLKPNQQAVETSVCPILTYPQLYEELLNASNNLPITPDVPDLSGNKIKLSKLAIAHTKDLISCSNGNAIFGESAYDPSRIWGWIEGFLSKERNQSNFLWPSSSVVLFESFYSLSAETAHHVKEKENYAHLVITDKELNKSIGMMSILSNNPKFLSVQIGNIWITPFFQGKQRSREAIYLVVKHLFDQGYRRVVVEVDSRHIVFRKFIEKIGFKLEAILRKNKIIYDRNSDTCIYVILNTEWSDLDYKLRRSLGLAISNTSKAFTISK